MAIVAQRILTKISILTDTKSVIGAYTMIIEVPGSAEQRMQSARDP